MQDWHKCVHVTFFLQWSMLCISEVEKRKTLLITCNEFLVIIIILFPFFLSGRFFRNGLTDFLEIFRKDAVHQYLGKFFSFVENSLPVGKYGRFSFFKKCFCPAVFSQTVKNRVMKFWGMIDLPIGGCNRGLSMTAVTSGPDRKWYKKSRISNLIF